MTDDRQAIHLAVVPAPCPGGLDDRDDDALMALVAAERREAYAVLAARHLPGLARYCAKFVGGARDGEELALDSLFEVWSQRRVYRPQGQFRVWLLTLARRRCLNLIRAEGRRRRWLAAESAEEVAGGPREPAGTLAADQIERLLASERARQVREAVLELSPKLREAVLLRFDQGLDYAEQARVVGAPEVTVRSRVFLALKVLRQALTSRENER